jgi:hypothetical protein
MTPRFLMVLAAGLVAGWALVAHAASPSAAATNAAATALLPPVLPRSPVNHFRELLAMTPADRALALTNRSPQARGFLEAKMAEFESLSESAREERLQTLQLRWLLLPMMRLTPAQREPRLAAMPEADRRLVEERLQEWDQLPAELQRSVLENESVIRLFFRPENSPLRPEVSVTNLSPAVRKQMEQHQSRWQAMSEEERARVLTQFERFFELNAKEKARILSRMGQQERRQMELALQRFAQLPKARRELCLRGYQKFAALSSEERLAFLSNAERWQAMTPKDRQLWREMVARLQPKPPLPPGLSPKLPPVPPRATVGLPLPSRPAQTGGRALTTN